MSSSAELRSAGLVILAGHGDTLRVALLRRVEPAEWRLPKGKLKGGESGRQAAEREAREEVGLVLDAGEELGQIAYAYRDPNLGTVHKTVRFYLSRPPQRRAMRPEQPTFAEARWATPAEALALLTWDNERQMVREALARAMPL